MRIRLQWRTENTRGDTEADMNHNFRYNAVETYRLTPVNTVLLAVNVVVFLVLSVLGDTSNTLFMYKHGASFWVAIFEEHEYYRLLTCTFIHFSLRHLFNNMLVLWGIGDHLERALGKIKYALFYLVTAVGSSFVSALWHKYRGEYVVSGGASGAVFGVVGALLVIVLMNRGRLEDLSSRRLMLFLALSIYHGVTSAGIDNASHIGGFVIGALLGLILYRRRQTYGYR